MKDFSLFNRFLDMFSSVVKILMSGSLCSLAMAIDVPSSVKVSQDQTSFKSTVLPQPVLIEALEPSSSQGEKSFKFSPFTRFSCEEKSFAGATKFMEAFLREGTGVKLSKAKGQVSQIIVRKAPADFASKGPEAYALVVAPEGIIIEANSPKGVIYAGQSLAQLLPSAFYEKDATKKASEMKSEKGWFFPLVKMEDAPRFAWRSFMLDPSRHFWTVEQTKRLIDQMAQMKMNILQWHLSDDAGWRLEIKKYPKLTSVGSKRADTEIGTWGSGKRAGKPHSGFYTQKEVKEIVQYAAQRNITVVPELGMIGHVSALVASYPELATNKTPISVPEYFGKLPSTLDPSQEKTFEFLSDVMDEVLALFPSKILHIGGDEVDFKDWENSPAVQKLAKDKGFKNVNTDVQVYFANRLSRLLEKKGARMMGWNEILGHDLHGQGKEASTATLSPTALVHFWKGDSRLATDAIAKGHDVVNSTHSMTYLDYSYSSISLEKAYSYNPVFSGLKKELEKNVLGSGCQMWTEWVSDESKLHYQVFPRLCAYAEVGWTSLDRKNYSDFKRRLAEHQKRMDKAGIQYAKDVVATLDHSDFFNDYKVGEWAPEQVAAGTIEWSLPEDALKEGSMEVTLLYSKGANALAIESVGLYEEGKLVSEDKHTGASGVLKKNVTYKVNLPALKKGAKYTLKAQVKGDAGNDSRGIAYLKK